MARVHVVDPKAAGDEARQLLDAVQSKLGATPNFARVLANSPKALEGFLGLFGVPGVQLYSLYKGPSHDDFLKSGMAGLIIDACATDRDFAHHHRKAQGEDAYEVNQEEYSPSVLSGQIRKTPDITQPDR